MNKILLLLFLFVVKISFTQNNLDSLSYKPIVKQKINLLQIGENVNKLPLTKKIIKYRKNNFSRDVFFIFLLNIFLIAALLFNVSKKNTKKLLFTLYNINILTQYSKVEIKRDNNYLYIYYILLMFMLAILLHLVFEKMELKADIVYLSFLMIMFFILDFTIHKISSYLFNKENVSSTIHFNNFSFIIISLPILSVGTLLVLYNSQNFTTVFLIFISTILAILYLWKEIRNLFILKANKINIFSFYFFLYLCTFKLVPLVIFFKIAYAEIIKT